MPDTPRDDLRALGYLGAAPVYHTDLRLSKDVTETIFTDAWDERVDAVSRGVLGLTIACARCHDHKFDPILTKDYYSLASIFASTLDFRHLGRPGSVSYIYYAPLDPAAYAQYQEHRWRMYAKQLEMEDALAEDLARENSLER